MRLSHISFKNYRCFRDEKVEISDYTSFVGPNNCGKSTILRSLNTFFYGNSKKYAIRNEDFYIGAPAVADLSIVFEFDDVTGAAEVELSHYVRNKRLIFEIVAHRGEDGVIDTKCRGIRFGLPQLKSFFASARAADRRPIYEELQKQFPDELPNWQNMTQAEESMRAFEAARPEDHVPIPSEENAYGATGPIPILRKYLDWIYVPAVKDVSSEATDERDSAFTKLILYSVRNRCNFSEQFQELKRQVSNSIYEILSEAEGILEEVGGDRSRIQEYNYDADRCCCRVGGYG